MVRPDAPAQTEFNLVYRPVPADYLAFHRHVWRHEPRSWRMAGIRFAIMLLAILAAAISIIGVSWPVLLLAGAFTLPVSVISFAADYFMIGQRLRRRRRNEPAFNHDQVLRISPLGIESECELVRAQLDWKGIVKAERGRHLVMLYTTPLCAILIPLRAFRDIAEADRLVELTRRCIADARQVDVNAQP